MEVELRFCEQVNIWEHLEFNLQMAANAISNNKGSLSLGYNAGKKQGTRNSHCFIGVIVPRHEV